MALSTLVHKHIFGLKDDTANNIGFAEDQLIVYPAGHNVILYNMEDKKQKFIHGSENTESITALSICPSKRFLAVAEKSERAIINIYDLKTLKKRKVLCTPECQSKQYVYIIFSPDNQLLLSQGGPPDWTLICWNWSKAKVMATTKYPINGTILSHSIIQCSFSHIDPTIICCTGLNMIKYYRIIENTFRSMPNVRMDMQHINCHTWIKQRDDQVIVGTFNGDLLLFHAGEFLCRLSCSPGDGKSIETIICNNKGIICGTNDSMIHFFNFNDDISVSPSESIILIKSIRLETCNSKVRNIATSLMDEKILITLSSGQILTLKYNPHDINNYKTDEIEPLLTYFHRPGDSNQSHITGLDVCCRKPILVTCGLDKTIRIWNYLEKTCELQKQCTEEPYSISMHPSGLHILVGFTDKLRLMNILMDDIRTFKEFPIKACRECQFSNGGHLFAAVNGNTIQIFSTYTCDILTNFRGHNGKIRSLFWNHNDSGLISAGMDGAIYQWNLEETKREGEFIQKGIPYFSAISNQEGTTIFASGADKMLKEIEFPSSQLNKEFHSDMIFGHIILSHSQRLFFAGVAELDKPGNVRSYKFPLTGDYNEYPCLSSSISRMRISYDDHFLFVAGEDGTICILEIKDKEGRSKNNHDHSDENIFSEEILVTKSDLEEKNNLMQELKNKVDELTLHNEYQLRLKDMNYNEKLKEVSEKFTHELEQDKNKFELLREEKNDMETEYDEKIKMIEEKHHKKIQELETSYQERIMKEIDIYQEILALRDHQKKDWENEQSRLITSHENYVVEITEDFEQKLDEDRQLRIQMEDEKQELKKEFNEIKRQLEEDIDQEIESLKMKYENKLNVEREDTLRYKGENGIMKKKFTALQKDIEDQREEIKNLLEKEKELYEKIKILEKEIQIHKREIRSRDETIGDKEKKIYELKKKNQELEKFKFVLDYKIKELKRQIEPRENEITNMKEQIKEMDQDLELFHKSNAQLDLMIGKLRNNLNIMQKNIMKERTKLADHNSFIKRFRYDLHQVIQFIQNPKSLKEKMIELNKKYALPSDHEIKNIQIDPDIQNEYSRQKEYLEKSVDTLKTSYNKEIYKRQHENHDIRKENMDLIKEITDLRNNLNLTKASFQTEKAAKTIKESHLKIKRKTNKNKNKNQSLNDKENNNNMIKENEQLSKKIQEQDSYLDNLYKVKMTLEQNLLSVKFSRDTILPPVKGIDG